MKLKLLKTLLNGILVTGALLTAPAGISETISSSAVSAILLVGHSSGNMLDVTMSDGNSFRVGGDSTNLQVAIPILQAAKKDISIQFGRTSASGSDFPGIISTGVTQGGVNNRVVGLAFNIPLGASDIVFANIEGMTDQLILNPSLVSMVTNAYLYGNEVNVVSNTSSLPIFDNSGVYITNISSNTIAMRVKLLD